jgi:ABC-2 type transport system ATP-binding protein
MTPPAVSGALVTSGLSKSYPVGHLRPRHVPVLVDLSLEVQPGEIFGYLGPNGSGKTTTLKIVTGLLHPDRGSFTVLGHPQGDRAWRYKVGYLPEHPYLYDYLTAREYLDYAGRLFGLGSRQRRDRSQHLLELVGLQRSADLPVRRFSKGMVQRAGIAQALVNDPELVILDEPMSGLDPIGRRLVRNIILDLKKAGKTVLFSTHILSDAETLCDRVAVLRSGRLLDVGSLASILKIDISHMEVLVSGLAGQALDVPGLRARQPLGERWRLEVDEAALGSCVTAVEAAGGRILSVQPIRQSLEDYFFKELSEEPTSAPWAED